MPVTMRQHEANLRQPAFCELLPIRDYLDNVIVRSNGALVAGYDLDGINSYYHSDETRNQTKCSLEALVRSLMERSMRLQVRFEVVEGLGTFRPAIGTSSARTILSFRAWIASGLRPGSRRNRQDSILRRCCTRIFIGIRVFIMRRRRRVSERNGQRGRRLESLRREVHPAGPSRTRRPGFGVRIHFEGH